MPASVLPPPIPDPPLREADTRSDSIRLRPTDTLIVLRLTGGGNFVLRGQPYSYVGHAARTRTSGGVFVFRRGDDPNDPFAGVEVLDAATGAQAEPRDALGMPALSPDGSRLAVIHSFDHGGYQVSIWRFDADSAAAELALEMPGDVSTRTPHMRWRGNDMLELFSADGGKVEERLVRRGAKWDFGRT